MQISIYLLFHRDVEQLQKRVEEEKRWFIQSFMILSGFIISLTPMFVLYIISCIIIPHSSLNPFFNLISWILFFSGACANFVTYNVLNPSFRRKFKQLLSFQRISVSNNAESVTKHTVFSRSKSGSAVNQIDTLISFNNNAMFILYSIQMKEKNVRFQMMDIFKVTSSDHIYRIFY